MTTILTSRCTLFFLTIFYPYNTTMALIRLILASILAIPPLLFIVLTIPVQVLLSLPSIALLLSRKYSVSNQDKDRSSSNDTQSKTVTTNHTKKYKQIIITGGSSGIGLAIAKAAVQQKDVNKVYIVARDKVKLNSAKTELLSIIRQKKNESIEVEVISCDVSNSNEINIVASTIMKHVSGDMSSSSTTTTICTHLFSCVGQAVPMHFDDMTAGMISKAIAVNQLSCMYTTLAFLPHMKRLCSYPGSLNQSTLTYCSSMAGQVGVFGYTSYSPTKFAIRGFVESLYMELLDQPNIHIQIAYPPDTDTPGFHAETETKPVETQLISDSITLASSEVIGQQMYKEATCLYPKLNVYFDFDGFLVSTLTSGFSPVTNLLDAVAQVSSLNLIRYIALFYLNFWRSITYQFQNKPLKDRILIEKKVFPNRTLSNVDRMPKDGGVPDDVSKKSS